MQANKRLVRYSLRRNTLDVAVPDGWPTERGALLMEVEADDATAERIAKSLWWVGCGYAMHFQTVEVTEPRKLSDAAKQSVRRKALKRRLEANAPLFAADLEREALEKNPEYFGVKK